MCELHTVISWLQFTHRKGAYMTDEEYDKRAMWELLKDIQENQARIDASLKDLASTFQQLSKKVATLK